MKSVLLPYMLLQRLMSQKTVTIFMKVCNLLLKSTSRSSLHGKHNPDVRNNNNRRLVDFCNFNNLTITNTLFSHRKIHQYTWHHPGQENGGHFLNYILINAQYRSCILDTKVFKKTLHIFDHFPVIAKFFKSLCHKQQFCNKSHNSILKLTENSMKA